MTVEQALGDVEVFLAWVRVGEEDADPSIVGEYAFEAFDAIRTLVSYARAIREVPTEHDQQAEMDKWDDLIYDMSKGEKMAEGTEKEVDDLSWVLAEET